MLDCPFKVRFSCSQRDGTYHPVSALEKLDYYTRVQFSSVTFSILGKDHISYLDIHLFGFVLPVVPFPQRLQIFPSPSIP